MSAAKRKTQRTATPEGLPKARWAQVSKLRPSRNARLHSEDQVALIAASITEFGWTNPALVDEKGFLLAGHGRWEAAKLLGRTRIPVISIEGLTRAQKRAYILADNRLAELAGWDPIILAKELGGLAELNFDLAQIGFDADAVRDALARAGRHLKATVPPDQAPPLEDAITARLGDLWVLDGHRVLCGDSRDPATLQAVTAGRKLHIVIADPPYGIGLDTDYSKLPKTSRGFRRIEGDDKPFDSHPSRSLVTHVKVQFWFGADYYAQTLGDTEHGGSWLVWDKRVDEAMDKGFGSSFELIWSSKRRRREILRVRWFQNHANDPQEAGSRSHPTQKPTELLRILLGHSPDGGHVYDPFSGSGSCIIAAEQTGRQCSAVEVEPAYVDVIIRRWQDFTSGEAVLEATGQGHAEVTEERLDGG